MNGSLKHRKALRLAGTATKPNRVNSDILKTPVRGAEGGGGKGWWEERDGEENNTFCSARSWLHKRRLSLVRSWVSSMLTFLDGGKHSLVSNQFNLI